MDNADWRNKVTITAVTPTKTDGWDVTHLFDRFQPGKLISTASYGTPGTYVFTIKSTGYEDVVVTVIVQ